ncbi:MAG: hypothetical protein IRZ16_16625 [Myxococcaceae bacterium]|nr:hypothetical protein [Myxococcaceae bacterium]
MLTRALAFASTVVPSVALACPYCAGRGGEGAFGTVAVLGVEIGAPFVVAAVAFVAIRSVLAKDSAHDEEAE